MAISTGIRHGIVREELSRDSFVPPLLNGTRRPPPPYALVRRATSHTRVQPNDIEEQTASLSRRSGSVSSKEETVYSTLV